MFLNKLLNVFPRNKFIFSENFSKKFKITDPPNVHKIIGSTHCNIDLFHNNKSRHKEKYDNIINIQY